jgi:hypothetical protein
VSFRDLGEAMRAVCEVLGECLGEAQKFLLAVQLLALPLAGCASHSSIMPDGQGGYTVSKQAATGFPGLGTLKSDLLQEASQYCASQGREFLLTGATETQPPYLLGNYPRAEINFQCAARR